MKMEFFDEPELEFGSGGTHVDIRHGIMLHGPLDLGEATAPTQIRVGLVGTAESVEGIRNWLEHCKTGVPAKASRLGNLFPPFPGFGAETTFHCDLAFHDRWTSTLRQREIDQLLKNPGSPTLVQDCVKLFVDNVATVRETAGPMVVEKRTAKEQRTIKIFEKEKIQLLRGPYGPYIKQGLRNFKLPKEKQETAADLTLEEVKAIIEDVKANPPKRVPRKKKGN